MPAYLTVADIIQQLADECDAEGGIRPWADSRDLHPSIVDKFLAGQRGPAPQLLHALGLEKVVVYRKRATRADRES